MSFSNMNLAPWDFDALFDQACAQFPLFAVGPPPGMTSDNDVFSTDISSSFVETPTLNTVGVNLADISPSKAASQQVDYFANVDWELDWEYVAPASPSQGRARMSNGTIDMLSQQQYVLPPLPPPRVPQSGPARPRAPRAPTQARTAGHPYNRPSTTVLSQPEVRSSTPVVPQAENLAVAVVAVAAAVVEPVVEQARGSIHHRNGRRRCIVHAGMGNRLPGTVAANCVECTIHRNVNRYINIQRRPHRGNGTGGNEETKARLIKERTTFLDTLKDPEKMTLEILPVIGNGQYEILINTYEARGGADYQPPASYLAGL